MSFGSNIFGNLDDFLENYDDTYLETSKLDNSTVESGHSSGAMNNKSTNKSSAKSNSKAKEKDSFKSSHKQSAAVPSVPETVATSNAVDHTNRSSLHDEMQSLMGMFNFVFCNKDPKVAESMKSHQLFSSTKRTFTTLNNTFHKRVPTNVNDIAKFKKRIEIVHTKLSQLYTLAEAIILTNAPKRSTVTRRRSRRLANSTPGVTLIQTSDVITLDDEGPTQTFGSSNERSSVIDVSTHANEVITLDSDDDSLPRENQCKVANNSFETENYEMRIKVKWSNGIETFNHRKHQKFEDIIAKLAGKVAADTSCILLNLEDRIIYAEDTPDSIGYKTFQFISGRVLKEKAPIMQKGAPSAVGNNDIISLKVQLATRKTPIRLQMDRNQTMTVLVIKCAEELKCNPADIKLYFDGDLIDNGSKPEDLELEGDELLDIRFAH